MRPRDDGRADGDGTTRPPDIEAGPSSERASNESESWARLVQLEAGSGYRRRCVMIASLSSGAATKGTMMSQWTMIREALGISPGGQINIAMVNPPKPKISTCICAAVVLLSALAIVGCASVDVSMRNDSGTDLRISACVDDTINVAAGETFRVGGVPEQGDLLCLVIHHDGSELCVAVPNAKDIDGTFPLSRAIPVAMSRCP